MSESVLSFYLLYRLLEDVEEEGPVFRLDGGGAARDHSLFAERRHQFAGGESIADVLLRECPAVRVYHAGVLFEGAGGEGDVGGYHDIVNGGLYSDVVIR